MPTYPTVPYSSIWGGSTADIENWFRMQTGPKVPITTTIVGTVTVANQADADALVGKLIVGSVNVTGGGTPTTPLVLHDFVVVGPSIDQSAYVYPVDANGNAINPADATTLNSKQLRLINFAPVSHNITVQDVRLDGQNERIYSGFGGASYVTGHLIQRVEIVRTGDDGGKFAKNSTYRHLYVHDMRPWINATDGTFFGDPNNARYPHQDAIQGLRDGCVVEECWLEGSNTPTNSSAILIHTTLENISSFIIRRSFLKGSAGYPLNFGNQYADDLGVGYQFLPNSLFITDNLVSKDFLGNNAHPNVPYSLQMYADCVTVSGNKWAEDRTSIPAPYVTPRPLLSHGAKIVYVGDSRDGNSNIGAADGHSIYAVGVGVQHCANAMNPRWRDEQYADATRTPNFTGVTPPPFSWGANTGVQGATAVGLRAHFAEFVTSRASKPDIVDIAAGVNGSDQQAEMDAIAGMVADGKAAGISRYILQTVTPVAAGFPNSVSKNTYIYNLNQLIRTWVAAQNDSKIVLCDTALAMAGTTANAPTPDANLNADKLHYNRRGAMLAAAPYNIAVNAHVSPGSLIDDLFATKPNLLASWGLTDQAGKFTTTTGGVASAGVTGSLPVNVNLAGPGSGRSTGSVFVNASGEIVLDVTPIGANAADGFIFSSTPTGKTGAAFTPPWSATNKWIQAVIEWEFDGWSYFTQPSATISRLPFDSTRFSTSMHFEGNPCAMPTGLFANMTPPFQLDAAATGFYFPTPRILANPTGASGVGRVIMKRMGVFEISSPVPDWT